MFVHIPKCAGTSVEDYFSALEGDFDPCELLLPDAGGRECAELRAHALPFEVQQHFTLQSIKSVLQARGQADFFERAFKFAVVRNPWARLASEAVHFKSHPIGKIADFLGDCDTITACIAKLCQVQYVDNHRFDLNQVDFLMADGAVGVDCIIRFEELQSGFEKVLAELKLPAGTLPHSKKARFGEYDYTAHYDSRTIELVGQRYQRDIEYFGYEFGGAG